MHIFITGAGGFIGSHLAERLTRDGHDVTAMAHYASRDTYGWLDELPHIRRVRGDVRDPDQMQALIAGHDVVYNLAAMGSVPQSVLAPRQFVETNIVGTLNVALAAAKAGARLIQFSTSEVYGGCDIGLNKESDVPRPRSPYAASKVGADALAVALSQSHGLKLILLRPFNTYGPRQSARAVIPQIILQTIDTECQAIHLGSAYTERDFLFVDDLIDAAVLALTLYWAELPYNVGTGATVTIKEVVRLVQDILQIKKAVIEEPERVRDQYEVRTLRADVARIRAVGWTARTPLRTGLRATVTWYCLRSEVYKGYFT